MQKQMKAALFYGKEDIRLESIDIPPVGDGDILLKIGACGICGSDARSYFKGVEERYKNPVIFGHEVTAQICELGSKVQGYKVGDRVVVAPIYGCGQCEFCGSGKENICENVVVFGCTHDGAFAEYMLMPEKGVARGALVKISDEISDAQGTMIEAFACCLHGLRRLNIKPGDSAVIFGSGPIGLAHMTLLKRLGAEKVGVLDIADNQLEQAKTFGADITINVTKDSWKDEVLNYFGKNGVDLVVTAAPSVASIESGLKIIKNGGEMLIFGGLPHGSVLSMDPNIIHYNEISITGSIDATIDDFRRVASMAGSLGLEKFITHSFALDKVEEGMDTMGRKEGLKIVLEMTK